MILTREVLDEFYGFYHELNPNDMPFAARDRLRKLLIFADPKDYLSFCYLADLLGYSQLPQVVPDEDYAKLQGRQFYRGSKNIDYIAALFADFDYHKGSGSYGSGIYASHLYRYALSYAYGHKENVASFKLSPDIRHITYEEQKELSAAFHDDVFKRTRGYRFYKPDSEFKLDEIAESNYKTLVEWCRTRKNDPEFGSFYQVALLHATSNLPMLLGYDVLMAEGVSNDYVILNRSKICISQSEFDRITEASNLYKGGVIDFDKKQEEDFLGE